MAKAVAANVFCKIINVMNQDISVNVCQKNSAQHDHT